MSRNTDFAKYKKCVNMPVDRKFSVVIPVLNERENVNELLLEFDRLVSEGGLTELYEVLFVDDGSSDGTVQLIEVHMAANHTFKIGLVERSTKLGTASASIEGAKATSGSAIIVMDADLQHPPHVILEMVKRAVGEFDVIVASRHIKGGGNQWSPLRGVISRTAIWIAHLLIPSTRKLRDPTSGYFVVRRELIENVPPLNNRAKILLYLLASHPKLKTLEIPYVVVDRKNGTSKLITRNLDFVTDYLIEVIGYICRVNRKCEILL